MNALITVKSSEVIDALFEKKANLGSAVIGGIGKVLGQGAANSVTKFVTSSATKRALTGAAVGGGLKALTYKPQYDEYGNDVNGGRLTSALQGAAMGGGLGVAVGQLAPKTADEIDDAYFEKLAEDMIFAAKEDIASKMAEEYLDDTFVDDGNAYEDIDPSIDELFNEYNL